MMAFSSNPLIREFQHGVSFAMRPLQGAVNDVAKGVSGIFQSINDIDRLHSDNTALRRENDRLLMRTASLAGHLDVSRAAAMRLAGPDQPLAVQLDAMDWLERITFSETGKLPAP